jgi:hypothetical protein
MSRKSYSLNRQLVVAAALALGASGIALADDSSMDPFTGDSYKYFNGHNLGEKGPFNRPVFSNAPSDPLWRRSHPNGLTERELAALSSSGISASASQLDPQIFAAAPADPSWRRTHPSGFTESELAALSSSTLARWQTPDGAGNRASASIDQADVAQAPEAFSTRLARIFRRQGGGQQSQ